MSEDTPDPIPFIYFSSAHTLQQQAARQCEETQRYLEEAAYAAILASSAHRNIAAQISPIAWLPVTPELLGFLGETSKAGFVLAMNAGAHIVDRRPREAAKLSDALRTTLAEILYYGQRWPGTRKYEIVVREPSGLVIFLGLKFLSFEDGGRIVDQCIASTAHAIGEAEIRRLVRRGRLCAVPEASELIASLTVKFSMLDLMRHEP